MAEFYSIGVGQVIQNFLHAKQSASFAVARSLQPPADGIVHPIASPNKLFQK